MLGGATRWTLDYLGFVTGYTPASRSCFPIVRSYSRMGCPCCWSPSIDAARSGDTLVVDRRGYEVVTNAQNWPQIDVAVKGLRHPAPGNPRTLILGLTNRCPESPLIPFLPPS